MEISMDTKLEIIGPEATKASIHINFCGGSFTISNILLKKLESGSWRFTMPLARNGDNLKPVITLQDGMKRAVFQALSEDHMALRTSGKRRIENTRTYIDAFPAASAPLPAACAN